jgi:predicted dienelactone hydrolase|tara:strand:- start:4433 stop:5830 length:1398 start_codon:yes stop_codon:yes gene_type:complete
MAVGCIGKSDMDSDNVMDDVDNCIEIFNSNQLNYDNDEFGDLCDDDDDNDLILDIDDSHPLDESESSDLDSDGIGDNSDNDIDGDGIDNADDDYPLDSNEKWDTDSDGIPNGIDDDDDGDGISDLEDQFDLTPFSSLLGDGPFTAGTRDLTFNSPRGHEITLQIWFPAIDESGSKVIYNNVLPGFALDDITPDCSEPRPVSIYSHGFPSIRWGSAFMMENLATHGFISIAPDHRYGTLLDANPDKIGEILLSMPLDIRESFDWLIEQSNGDGELSNCIIEENGYSIIGQSTGGYASMMISGAEISLSDLELGCEINNPIHCNAIDFLSQNNELNDIILLGDDRVWASILLSPWNGTVLNQGISRVSVPTLILTGDIDDTTVISEVNNTSLRLGSNLVNYGIFNNSGHYAFAPIGCAVRGCEGQLDIGTSTDLANESAIIFLAQELNWPSSELYDYPISEHITWKY